jgi:molybdate transport system substrate-binding protein
MTVTRGLVAVAAMATGLALAPRAEAAEIKVLTAGAYKQVIVDVAPQFEKQTGHKLVIQNDTVGALVKRIDGGEAFDVVVVTPAALDNLMKKGKLADGVRAVLARVGVGVMVKDGAPKPDVSSVEAFKKAVLDAKTVAYIDPASGGSSGIYVDRLLQKLGIAEQARLKKGGHVSDYVLSGEAELGIHQISEIVTVKGVTLVGPLPAEIQNFTTYAGGLGAAARDAEAAKALIRFLASGATMPVLKSRGMDAPSS